MIYRISTGHHDINETNINDTKGTNTIDDIHDFHNIACVHDTHCLNDVNDLNNANHLHDMDASHDDQSLPKKEVTHDTHDI